jgi:hypothetical protein
MVKYDDKTVAQWHSKRIPKAESLLSIWCNTTETMRNVREDLGLHQLYRCGS